MVCQFFEMIEINRLIYQILIGFTYRGLSPHKLTPMLGVHNRSQATSDPERWQGIITDVAIKIF